MRELALIELTSIFDIHNIIYTRRKPKRRFNITGQAVLILSHTNTSLTLSSLNLLLSPSFTTSRELRHEDDFKWMANEKNVVIIKAVP